jgi:hypothetical protein
MTVLVELAGLCHFRKPRASALSLMIFPLVDSINLFSPHMQLFEIIE